MIRTYQGSGTFYPSTSRNFGASLVNARMDWALIVAAMVSFGLAATALCISYLRSKANRQKRKVGYEREEIHIDAAKVPEFKPTWRNTR